jgi:predicted ATPase/class 3 adenylate cyclase
MDVGAWLCDLGLGQYERAFRENDIDAGVLPDLTAEDLIGLGVTSIGHRRKLLAAIAALRSGSAAPAPLSRPTLSALPGTLMPPAEAERRQLAVMFVDLVGSTALAARLDPEDVREVIKTYHRCVADTVRRFGGFVAKYLGDGVLVYFGWPQADETDAERSVRAALAVVEAVDQSAPAGERLAARVGIASGLAVVGDLLGAGAAQEQAVIGETPNLAARLQSLAEPGCVVIDPETRQRIGGLFECRELGPVYLKGLPGPLCAWQVLREAVVQSRFEALHEASLTPLIGRDEELDLLLRCWRQARSGEGQVVLISGEPGIGKSRLIAALEDWLCDQGLVKLRYFCSPHHRDSALEPVISRWKNEAGLVPGEAADTRLNKLEALLRPLGADAAEVALIAELLGVPGGQRYPPPALSPERKKDLTFEALNRILDARAHQSPVLMLFEDAHWADPSSLELLDRLIMRVASLPVLLIISFRPEFQAPWVGWAGVTFIELGRLSPDQAATLTTQVVAGQDMPAVMIERIVAQTDGVPLFIEELTKAVLEDTSRPAAASSTLPMPKTLQGSLMARLDRLPAAKTVAQISSAIGREFSQELLLAVAGLPEGALAQGLDELAGAGLVFRRGAPREMNFSFKHALVQDAAYMSLLRTDRQRLHARIADTLEQHFPEWVAREPELLAHHCIEARQVERALGYMLKAGERAIERSANVEAIRHLMRGLDALGTLPETPERDRQELAFQIAIGTPLIAVHGYSSPETGAAFSRARVLCERLGEAEPLVATLSGEFVFHFVRGNYPAMRQLTAEVQRLSKRLPDPILQLASHRLAGITAMHAGEFPEARSEFEAILALYDPGQHRSHPVHYVHDPKVSALTYLALVLWILGFPDQAQRSSTAAFACAGELNQANLTAHVHNFAGAGLDELLGDVAGVQTHAAAILELAERHNLHYWRLNALILQGWVMTQGGDMQAGLTLMHQAATDRSELAVGWYQARYLCMLAAAYAQAGLPDAGLQVVAEAKDLLVRNNEQMWRAELWRVEGELLRLKGVPVSEVEEHFEHALAISRRQNAKSFELRAATSLARLWRDQGRGDQARHLLADLYSWFSEGSDTLDLTAARTLLQDLGEHAA